MAPELHKSLLGPLESRVRNLNYVRFKLKETFTVWCHEESEGDGVLGQPRGSLLSGTKRTAFCLTTPASARAGSFSSLPPSLLSSLPGLPLSLLFSFFPSSAQRRHIFPREHPLPPRPLGPRSPEPGTQVLSRLAPVLSWGLVLGHGRGSCWLGQGGASYPLGRHSTRHICHP